MKKIYLLTAVSVLTLSGAEVWAAEANGTGNISAKIVAPVTVTEQDALDFGTILAPTDSAKKVKIAAANGARSVDGGDNSILVNTNKGAAGLFNVSGAENQKITIQLPDSATLNVLGGEGTPMTVNNFVSDPATELTLNGTSGQIKVGATLTVNQNQAEGDYSGDYTVTVSY